ncbi:MAG TPA: aminoglycoside 3'-phosphotransferase [Desulfitobacterium dehalogenans]|uniref:Aminoglycoside 3'-phosphotransferase n=1 Tax=Desulfitobacterium dehalogenans TaxID=36854 RepID=A0A7C7D9W6_9FIRM|nr:aminoglycoside 3'-phosphotransferase [Desulfitobacterium dehalogenans]
MKLTPLNTADLSLYPPELRPFFYGAKLYDSSSSPEASVIFIDKDGGYFLKSAPQGVLEREAIMTRYFHDKGMSTNILAYLSGERDWLLTEKIRGADCTAVKYLEQPERLCDTLAERLAMLHAMDYAGCPIPNHTERYLAKAEYNHHSGIFDKSLFPGNWGYASAEEAWLVVERHGHLLRTDTLLHGDYCLPNIILDDWRFSGFIDLDSGGVGDCHVDLFWAVWTLFFNLKTDKYRERFIDAYGRDKVDEDMLRIVAAVEVFG